jgi:predicted nucleic acid-binding protein
MTIDEKISKIEKDVGTPIDKWSVLDVGVLVDGGHPEAVKLVNDPEVIDAIVAKATNEEVKKVLSTLSIQIYLASAEREENELNANSSTSDIFAKGVATMIKDNDNVWRQLVGISADLFIVGDSGYLSKNAEEAKTAVHKVESILINLIDTSLTGADQLIFKILGYIIKDNQKFFELYGSNIIDDSDGVLSNHMDIVYEYKTKQLEEMKKALAVAGESAGDKTKKDNN